MISFLLTTLPIGIQDTAADLLKDIDEEDTLEITSQTSPMAQIFYLSHHSYPQLYRCRLICTFFLPDSTSLFQMSQDSFLVSSGNVAIFSS
jgi:hypothetical protein